MNKEEYVNSVKNNNTISDNSKKILINQINNYYDVKSLEINKTKYNVGDDVKLSKGTLLHGTYKNIDGLKAIASDGLISSWFIDGRLAKYPSSVGVWNLKQDYLLKDYINLYSGATIIYRGVKENDEEKDVTSLIPYNELNNLVDIVTSKDYHMWSMEQTKEARFMPSLVQDRVQIGIIFNGNQKYISTLLKGNILNPDNITDEDVKEFVNPTYYETFIVARKNKDDFFTDRESAILFGVPANLIEGVLVGRQYEKDDNILNEIKSIIPNCYICNLDGKVIVGNK